MYKKQGGVASPPLPIGYYTTKTLIQSSNLAGKNIHIWTHSTHIIDIGFFCEDQKNAVRL